MPRKAKLGWHHRKLGIPALWENGVTGKGIRIAVLDTGVARIPDLDRPSFEYLDDRGNSVGAGDTEGHGTPCASLLVSRRDGALGLARDASISSYRVLGSGDLAAKVDRALAAIVARDDIDVVLCAFVMDKATLSIKASVRQLAERGTVVVAAAGNEKSRPSEFPELTAHAITAAGITQDDVALSNARTGVWIDVAAPGEKLAACSAAGQTFEFGDTSGAAALVAGVAALALGTRTGAKRRAVGRVFESMAWATARKLPLAAPDSVGRGLIDPVGILQAIDKGV